MGSIERFGHFEIAQGADAQPVELLRSRDERVFLALDTRIRRLVELHVLKAGERLHALEKSSALERTQLAAGFSFASFIRILACGEDRDVVYYSSSLNDGERLEAYIARRGPVPSPTAFSLLLQLLDDLLRLQESPHLISEIRLDNLFITLQEETFLRLRALDFGLSNQERDLSAGDVAQRVVHEMCLAAFLMLTGKPYEGDDCDRQKVLTGLPSGLRSLLRASVANAANAPASIQRLRDEVRDALIAQTRDLQGRSSRRHLVATDAMLPQSALREILLHDVRMEQVLKGRLVPENAGAQERYPFTFEAVDARTQARLNVHLLPPRRIVSNEHYDAVPPQVWRFNADKHPNILRSLGVWESPDLTFLTEERVAGFPLSRLIAERFYLNPSEVLNILRQVKAGLDQALECGVAKPDIHPCNIFLNLGGATHSREVDKLLQKRLDAWPKFTVLLRPHMTMRSLYEPLLMDAEGPVTDDNLLDATEFRSRSYVALAAYLLSGERHVAGRQRLPDFLPDKLAAYISDCATRWRHPGKTPSPEEFLLEFEKRATLPEAVSAAGGLVLPARQGGNRTTAMEEPMESAGSVSDFEEDNLATLGDRDTLTATNGVLPPTSDLKMGRRKLPRKSLLRMMLVAGVLLALAVIGYTLFSGDDSKPHTDAGSSVQPSAAAATQTDKKASD